MLVKRRPSPRLTTPARQARTPAAFGHSAAVLALLACLGAGLPAVAAEPADGTQGRDVEAEAAEPTLPIDTADQARVVAEAAMKATYGHDAIERQKPLLVRRERDIWIVSGTLPSGRKGGVAEIWLSAGTGEVIRITHDE